VNLLGDNITNTLTDASKEKTKYMLVSHHQNAGQNRDIKITNRSFTTEPLSSRLLSKNLKIGIYKTIILSVVLYMCETWSLTLREEHRLRVFVNKVLRRIFGPKRDEVMGEWRKLHNKELHDLYSSPSIIRIIKLRRMR
jgi:hypothetical protein